MRHFYKKKRRRPSGNVVMHVPSTMGDTISGGAELLFVIQSPSILAGLSATTDINAQDKDRTCQVGHHVGQVDIDFSIRTTAGDGTIEYCIAHVERSDIVPVIGTFPIPSATEINAQGLQQIMRLNMPGRIVHFSVRAYTAEHTMVHKIKFRPSKFKSSKVKAGDHWILLVHNRGSAIVTSDFQCRYKEYE